MHLAELTPAEQRVLGCLIEKRWTTPDQYPLSLNGLRLACNQSTNRDPVTSYDEGTVREAAQRLYLYGLARLASGHGSRATKYRHLAEEALGLGREELAVLAVLLLRGAADARRAQGADRAAGAARVAGRCRARAADVDRARIRQADRQTSRAEGGPVRAPARRSGRWRSRRGYGGEPTASGGPVAPTAPAEPAASTAPVGVPAAPFHTPAPAPLETPAPDADGGLAERVSALEAEVAALRSELDELRELYG